MSRDIILHPEHGLNATISQCLYCGKEKNELALLGAAYKGKAPMRMVVDDVPCDECQAQFDRGIALFEHNGTHRTGRAFVLTEEWLERVEDVELRENIRRKRAAFVTVKDFESMFRHELAKPLEG